MSDRELVKPARAIVSDKLPLTRVVEIDLLARTTRAESVAVMIEVETDDASMRTSSLKVAEANVSDDVKVFRLIAIPRDPLAVEVDPVADFKAIFADKFAYVLVIE